MSSRLRCLHTSLRALDTAPAAHRPLASRAAAARRSLHASAARPAAQAQLAPRPEVAEEAEPHAHPRRTVTEPRGFGLAPAGERPRRLAERADAPESASDDALVEHLNTLFKPLEFPPEVARRILTHASHRDAVNGHNGRLSFIGRRVLDAYFLAFLHSTPNGARADHAALAERVLNAYAFGEHVAGPWQLARVLRWAPPGAAGAPDVRAPVGLYKVAGTAVEALVGGVFHQHGGAAAHRLFHTRVLPRLPSLPEPFRSHALEVAERMGGFKAPLLPSAAAPRAAKKAAEAPAQPVAPGKHVPTHGAPKVARAVPTQAASRVQGAEKVERIKLAL